MGDPFETESTAGEKFFLVSVPNWNNGGALSSFLCLGGVSGDPGKNGDPNFAKAETLAQLVQGFVDDDRDRGTPPNSAPAETAPAGSPAPSPVPTPTDPNAQARRNESAVLHSKGGWRDHSDGNRISTTVGDKVEVVRGNYKLVVLGRQDELQNSTGVDMSGGITDPSTTAMEYAAVAATGGLDSDFTGSGPPAGTNNQAILENIWQWVTTDADGIPRWHVTQRTGNVYQANTAMTTQTWAYSIDTYTGSSVTPVHEMSDTTYADSQTSATTITHDQNVSLSADNISSSTDFGTKMSTTASGGLTWTNTMYTWGDISNVNFSSLIIYTDLAVIGRNELDIAPYLTEMKISGAIQEFKIGNHTDLHAMAHLDAHMGSHIDMHLGPHLDIHTEKVTLGDDLMSMHDARAHLSDVFNFL